LLDEVGGHEIRWHHGGLLEGSELGLLVDLPKEKLVYLLVVQPLLSSQKYIHFLHPLLRKHVVEFHLSLGLFTDPLHPLR